jgi:hypothetical protein
VALPAASSADAPAEIETFRTWLPRGRVDQKRADALLERMRADLLQAAQLWVHGLDEAAAQVAFDAFIRMPRCAPNKMPARLA